MIQEIFPIPIGVYKLDHTLDTLQKWCYGEEQKSKGRTYSNVSGWQSNSYHPEDIEGTPLSGVIFDVKQCALEMYRVLGIHREPSIWDSWININPPGGFNRVHVHPNTRVAGAFWIKSTNTMKSGNITFVRNNSYEVESIVDDDKNKYSRSIATYEPHENNLILFPAYLQHHVEQNQTDEDRISMSFNML